MPQHRDDEPRDDLRARVGDLALRVENGFNRVDAELRDLRQEMNRRFEAQRAEIKEDLNAQRVEIRGLRMLIYGFGSSLIVAVLGTRLVPM